MSGDRVISVNGKEASRNGSERERERDRESTTRIYRYPRHPQIIRLTRPYHSTRDRGAPLSSSQC